MPRYWRFHKSYQKNTDVFAEFLNSSFDESAKNSKFSNIITSKHNISF